MTIPRDEPPLSGSEHRMLWSFLEFHRASLLRQCEGLTSTQLKRRAVPASTLSLLGLIRHSTENELHWFGVVWNGLPREHAWVYTAEVDDADFDALDDTPVDEVFDRYRAACRASDAILAESTDLDAMSGESPWGRRFALRWICLHMLREYSRHNGHADLLRETVDGRTGI